MIQNCNLIITVQVVCCMMHMSTSNRALPIVNCIVLGRAIEVASKSSIKTSFLDAIGVGLGYTLVLMILGAFREILGNNTITLMDSVSGLTGYRAVYKIYTPNNLLPMNILIKPAGAFISLAFLMALFNHIKGGNKDV